MKATIIIKNSATKVKIYSDYMIIDTTQESRIVGFRNVHELYLNKLIALTPAQLLKMAKYFNVNFIDQHGYVLGSIRLYHDKS